MKSCWISPAGEIISVAWNRHGKTAMQILGEHDLYPEAATLKLARLGWLHIGPTPFVSFTRYNDLPDVQAQALHTVLKELDGMLKINVVSYLYT